MVTVSCLAVHPLCFSIELCHLFPLSYAVSSPMYLFFTVNGYHIPGPLVSQLEPSHMSLRKVNSDPQVSTGYFWREVKVKKFGREVIYFEISPVDTSHWRKHWKIFSHFRFNLMIIQSYYSFISEPKSVLWSLRPVYSWAVSFSPFVFSFDFFISGKFLLILIIF